MSLALLMQLLPVVIL